MLTAVFAVLVSPSRPLLGLPRQRARVRMLLLRMRVLTALMRLTVYAHTCMHTQPITRAPLICTHTRCSPTRMRAYG